MLHHLFHGRCEQRFAPLSIAMCVWHTPRTRLSNRTRNLLVSRSFFLLFFCILFRKILIYFRLYCSILYEIFVRFLSWNKNKKEGFFFCFYCTKIKVKGSELVFPRMELWGTNPRLSLLAALSCSAASTRLAPREACDEAVLGTEPAVCACLGDKTRLPYILISRDTLLSLRITVVRWDLDACARVAHLNIFHA